MPAGHIVRNSALDVEKLTEILKKEWRTPTLGVIEPVLIEEPSGVEDYKRLYVIWSRWKGFSQRQRTEIILKSYRSARPVDALNVTTVMGLTPEEAADMGIQYALGKNEENE